MKKSRATRRSFLKAVGAGATALPFYRLLENSVLAQAGQPLPLRFCGIYHPHGIAAEYFASLNGRFSGLGSDTETTFNLTYTTAARSACCSRSTTPPRTARASRARSCRSRGST